MRVFAINLVSVSLLVASVALAHAADGAANSDPVFATWTGGQASAAAVEARLGQVAQRKAKANAAGAIDALLERYLGAARQEALAQLVIAEVGDSEEVLEKLQPDSGYERVKQQLLLSAYQTDLTDTIEVDEEASQAYYEANTEMFATPRQATLWNIYLRHGDGGEAATLETLGELRERYLNGETFGALAREYSESETRLKDGRVGNYAEGKLPDALGDVVFALEDQDISEPLPVSDGAVLLHVTDVVEASTLPFEEAEPRIKGILRGRLVEEALRAKVADHSPADGSIVLSNEEYAAATDLEVLRENPDKVVLKIGAYEVTARQSVGMLGSIAAPADINLDDDSEEARARRRDYGYAGLVARALLYQRIENEDGFLSPASRQDVQDGLAKRRRQMIVDAELKRRVREDAGKMDEELRAFYDDNVHHFQSELRFETRVLQAPLGDEAMATMRKLEELREKLAAGEVSLDDAAKEVGGEVLDLGTVNLSELAETTPKLPGVVLDLGSAGFAVPFQDRDLLQLAQVVDRKDPETQSFDDVREQVVDEFLERRQRGLTKELMDSILADAKFTFDVEAVKAFVVPPAL